MYHCAHRHMAVCSSAPCWAASGTNSTCEISYPEYVLLKCRRGSWECPLHIASTASPPLPSSRWYNVFQHPGFPFSIVTPLWPPMVLTFISFCSWTRLECVCVGGGGWMSCDTSPHSLSQRFRFANHNMCPWGEELGSCSMWGRHERAGLLLISSGSQPSFPL